MTSLLPRRPRPSWSASPQARAVLAKIVAADLSPVTHVDTGLSGCYRDEHRAYEGPLVDELTRLSNIASDRAIIAHRIGRISRAEACDIMDPTITDAIDAAFNAAAVGNMLADAEREAA